MKKRIEIKGSTFDIDLPENIKITKVQLVEAGNKFSDVTKEFISQFREAGDILLKFNESMLKLYKSSFHFRLLIRLSNFKFMVGNFFGKIKELIKIK